VNDVNDIWYISDTYEQLFTGTKIYQPYARGLASSIYFANMFIQSYCCS